MKSSALAGSPAIRQFSPLLAAFGLLVGFETALAQEGEQLVDPATAPVSVQSTKVATAPLASATVTVSAGTGIGVFQDVQVPVADGDPRLRADGRIIDEENTNHVGFPFHGGIGWRVRDGAMTADVVQAEILHMRAATGPSATQSSSYSRVGVGSAMSWNLRLAGGQAEGGIRAGLRRSSFNNISSSHYVESLLIGAGAAYRRGAFTLGLSGAAAPVARLGYSEDAFLGGKPFDRSKATLAEVALTSALRIRGGVWLDAGLEHEMITAVIEDVTEYDAFGLYVSPTEVPSRSYKLATTVLKVGIRKEF